MIKITCGRLGDLLPVTKAGDSHPERRVDPKTACKKVRRFIFIAGPLSQFITPGRDILHSLYKKDKEKRNRKGRLQATTDQDDR